MKKVLIALFLAIALLFSTFYISLSLIDFSKIYHELVAGTALASAKIKDDVFTLEKLPTPILTIKEINQPGKIELKNINVKFSLLSIMTFSPSIQEIVVEEVKIHVNNDNVNFLNHHEFISELIARDVLNIKAKVEKLIFVESDNDVPFTIDQLDFANQNGNTIFSGNISNIGSVSGNLKNSNDSVLFDLNVKDKSYEFHLEEVYKNNVLQNGKAELITTNLIDKISRLVPDFGNFEKYLSGSEKVKINFNILPTKGGLLFDSLVVNSDSIQAQGNVNLSTDINSTSEINLQFNKLDLDSWAKSKPSNITESLTKFGTNKRMDFNKGKTLINLFASTIKVDENNTFTNMIFKSEIANGKLQINDFSGQLDKDGNFRITGEVNQNAFRSIFDGMITMNHKDLNDFVEFLGDKNLRTSTPIPFYFSSSVKFSSVDISLHDFFLKTNNTTASGTISSKFIGNTPRTNANIRLSEINVDDANFPVINKTFDYIATLSQDMKDESYLSKFIPIRKISSISDVELTFDRLTYNKNLYENVSFDLALSPGKVSIDNLSINYGQNYLETSFSLEAQSIRPALKILVNDGNLTVSFLSAPGFFELKKYILDNFDLSKIDIIAGIRLSEVLQKDSFAVNNIRLEVNNDKNLFNITKLEADIFGGKLQSTGSILLSPYTLNFVYAISSAKIDEINKLLPKGMVNSSGYISASGMWSTNGEKLEEQLYNLYTKSNVITKSTSIANFSIDNLIQNLGDPNYNSSTLKDDLNKTLLLDKTDISDLQTNVELSKGVFTLSSIIFKTKYSSAQGSATFNLYDFNLDAKSTFSFLLPKVQNGRTTRDYLPSKLTVTAKGNFLNPKKEANTDEISNALKDRFLK